MAAAALALYAVVALPRLPGRGGWADRAPRLAIFSAPAVTIPGAALRSLAPEQVTAVLAHEQAHLRGRHHLVLAAAEAFCRAFPRLPLFAPARSGIARLIELLADDVAACRHPRIHIGSRCSTVPSRAEPPSQTMARSLRFERRAGRAAGAPAGDDGNGRRR
ncbi:M56 family metallopeptidase [Streptosporangium sp. NPDC049644]|uniref:M56 family metallopeptidase n=1 Tax=Streptosporangium sp. NPDC049644 TaxID=3155507 RepID=UPI00344074DF